jgi:epoxyqueuosine reductase
LNLYSLLLEKAAQHDFPLSGGIDLDAVLEKGFQEHVARFDTWLAQQFDGEMGYLRRGRDRRADPKQVFPKAQSVFCVAVPYWRQPLYDSPTSPKYARYLRGPDYHRVIPERLEALLQEVQKEWPRPLEWKVCVDTSAVLERSWAAIVGLGWIGKNTTLIHPKYGSYLFLGAVLLSEKLDQGPNPLPNYCGNCTRCLDGCPTQAFTEPGKLDSRRCISYWTLEKRGEIGVDESDKKKMGTWIAGCDICQEVCPFNLKPAREKAENTIHVSDATTLADWLGLLNETTEQYRERIKDSSLERIKPAQFSRNLAIALRNALELSAKDTGADTGELQNPLLLQAIEKRLTAETDGFAKSEWQATLSMANQRR